MGILKKAAALGAVAAVGAIAVNKDKVKKAVRGMIRSGDDAVHAVADKADVVAKRADKALKSGGKKAKKKARRKARKAARAAA